VVVIVAARHGTGSHFVTQRPRDPVDPVTLFYNELQMWTNVWRSILRPKILIIIRKRKSSLHGLTSSDFSPTTDTLCHFSISKRFAFWAFFRKPKKLESHTGSNDDPVTRTWKMTQMTHWPGDPMTQFHVWLLQLPCDPVDVLEKISLHLKLSLVLQPLAN